eukprot:691179-Prorocentrum_lima.AAC.1
MPCATTNAAPDGHPAPTMPQVRVSLIGIGGRCSLSLPALCSEKEILRSAARALHLQQGAFYLKMGMRLFNNWTSVAERCLEENAEIS